VKRVGSALLSTFFAIARYDFTKWPLRQIPSSKPPSGWKEPWITRFIVIGCAEFDVKDIAGWIHPAKKGLNVFRGQSLYRGKECPLVVVRPELIIYEDAVAVFARAVL